MLDHKLITLPWKYIEAYLYYFQGDDKDAEKLPFKIETTSCRKLSTEIQG
jgi:hypothetical protein